MAKRREMGERLKEARKKLDRKQEDFGSRLGVKGGVVSAWESGVAPIPEGRVYTMQYIFNINPEWIWRGKEPIFLQGNGIFEKSPKEYAYDYIYSLFDRMPGKLRREVAELCYVIARRYLDLDGDDRDSLPSQYSHLAARDERGEFAVGKDDVDFDFDDSDNGFDDSKGSKFAYPVSNSDKNFNQSENDLTYDSTYDPDPKDYRKPRYDDSDSKFYSTSAKPEDAPEENDVETESDAEFENKPETRDKQAEKRPDPRSKETGKSRGTVKSKSRSADSGKTSPGSKRRTK